MGGGGGGGGEGITLIQSASLVETSVDGANETFLTRLGFGGAVASHWPSVRSEVWEAVASCDEGGAESGADPWEEAGADSWEEANTEAGLFLGWRDL